MPETNPFKHLHQNNGEEEDNESSLQSRIVKRKWRRRGKDF